MARSRWIIGCMSGTSLDGLDAALVHVQGTGRSLRATFEGMASVDLDDLRPSLQRLTRGEATAPLAVMQIARRLGRRHVDAVEALLSRHERRPINAIVAHGQTIWHAPDERLSWQLMDPWPLVQAFGVPVLYDLRQADLIAGGQGAPITPLADAFLYPDLEKAQLVVNLGGICNVTALPPEAVTCPQRISAGDIGPCNLLLDGLYRLLVPGGTCDRDGAMARRGTANSWVSEQLATHPYFGVHDGPRSTGREDFTEAWIADLATRGCRIMSDCDLLASAVDGVAKQVSDAAGRKEVSRVILAGGGARNLALVDAIARRMPRTPVILSDELGVPCEAREAVGFAVLGALCQDGLPITLPQVTGAQRPGVAGAWAGPLPGSLGPACRTSMSEPVGKASE